MSFPEFIIAGEIFAYSGSAVSFRNVGEQLHLGAKLWYLHPKYMSVKLSEEQVAYI